MHEVVRLCLSPVCSMASSAQSARSSQAASYTGPPTRRRKRLETAGSTDHSAETLEHTCKRRKNVSHAEAPAQKTRGKPKKRRASSGRHTPEGKTTEPDDDDSVELEVTRIQQELAAQEHNRGQPRSTLRDVAEIVYVSRKYADLWAILEAVSPQDDP